MNPRGATKRKNTKLKYKCAIEKSDELPNLECNKCVKSLGQSFCSKCEQVFCSKCDKRIHRNKSRRVHKSTILVQHFTRPLYVACQNKSLDIIEELLKNNADPNLPNIKNGATPLYMACQKR
eukprot:TRINITY_DN2959_c0_g1_i1.p1 TRINITY_DN2959_c0_g1~~TRINITY_DN2959_c0_g1_i1.p1  ORF type:complete len:122 (+),score=12.12 TRINITY_DN2959_c0_g1_i1:55-420(+)